MRKITLEFNGSHDDFQKAIDSMDDNFNINDSIFYEMDYGGTGSDHATQYGNIKINYYEE